MAEQAAINMMTHADLNKDGTPDLEQIKSIAAKFGKAAGDFQLAVDWSKAGAALALLQAAAPKVLVTVNADLLANHEIDYSSVFSEITKPAVRQELGKVLTGALSLLHSVDGAKLAVAIEDLKLAYAEIQAYCKGFEPHHKAIEQKH